MILHYDVSGHGPSLVLLHGWALNRHVWTNLSEHLIARYRVIRVDLPGHGRSPSMQPYTLHTVVDAVVATIESDAINNDSVIKPVNIVGWSLGGMVAMQLAISYPQYVGKLIVLAASAQFVESGSWPYGVQKQVLENFCDALLKDHRATILRFLSIQSLGSVYAKQEIRELKKYLFVDGEPDQQALLGGLNILLTSQLQTNLAKIACDTLIMVGLRDSLVKFKACEATAAAIPQCELVTIKDAGHAVFISHPQLFQQSLHAFLS